jgi:glycosyltransferase involved in cell wall biosynthesis
MPKLLQINITANWGSTGKIAETIGSVARKQGWESYIAFGGSCNTSQSHLIRVGGKYNRYIHYAEQRIRDNEGLCSRFATKTLIEQIRQLKPDVIQLHNIHDHYLNYRLLFEYLNQTDIKVVWTFHDCWAFTGHCFHFVTAECEKWKIGCFDCPLKNAYPKTCFDNSKRNYELKKRLFLSNKNLTIVPCSDWMANFVRQSFLRDKRIEVIKNGVDLNVFKPLVPQKESDGYRILAVSSIWNKEKGLDDIYKLRELLPNDYIITVVGLSEKQVNELPRGITGIRRTQNVQELVALYSNARVLINTTYADTFPTVNLEALACGTPVVTYRTGGAPESISEDTGFVVEQGDIMAMADAVKTICNTDEVKYREACRERAEEFFDKNMCFEQYLSLYNSLLII